MSDTGQPCVTELARRYDVTITKNRDGDSLTDPAEFPAAVERSISQSCQHREYAHGESDCQRRVLAADQPVAVALAVVTDALKRPVASSTR